MLEQRRIEEWDRTATIHAAVINAVQAFGSKKARPVEAARLNPYRATATTARARSNEPEMTLAQIRQHVENNRPLPPH